MTKRNNYSSHDAEFGFDHGISEDRYNKLRTKEQKKSMPQPHRKKKRKPKAKPNHFKGLGSSKGRGPWPR